MSESKIPQIYVREDKSAVLNCPHCGRQKAIPVDKLKGHKHKLKVKCSCKKTFTVNLEFRKRIRKKVYLRGTYVNHSKNRSRGDIFVMNISVNGLEFTSLDIQDFKVGDELTVEFNLDDEHQFEISKDVIVREVRQRSVGCEFETLDELAFVGPLGHYVMS
jgi:hypothetical protein